MDRENNYVRITGRIMEEFQFDHECMNIKFYKAKVKIMRLNRNNCDIIPIIVPESLIKENVKNSLIDVSGEYRSYNLIGEERVHLKLFVYVREINYYAEDDDENFIYLHGFIVKPPKLRTTPEGHIIADLHLAINRNYNKSDYIPCIAWYQNAWYASELRVGDEVKVTGRIQSRNYIKRYSETREELKTTYEVSLYKINK